MSEPNDDELKDQILAILYKLCQQNPTKCGVQRDEMKTLLSGTEEQIDSNVLYLNEKGLAKIYSKSSSHWLEIVITGKGIDVIEHKEKYADQFPFLHATGQKTDEPVGYGTPDQEGNARLFFNQKVNDTFRSANNLVEAKSGLSAKQKQKIKEHLKTLEKELKNKRADAGKIQKTWEELRKTADWVLPTLSQVVLEGLRIALNIL